jgi:hypothetical protein
VGVGEGIVVRKLALESFASPSAQAENYFPLLSCIPGKAGQHE